MRTIFEVCAEADGTWCVGPERGQHARYTSYEEALAAALDAAEQCWERYRIPTGVRVKDVEGNVRDEREFGEVKPYSK